MILNSQKTIYSVMLQNALFTNTIYRPPLNTTLNEKFLIQQNFEVSDLQYSYPRLKFFTIGTGGADSISNNLINVKRSKHNPTDAALFKHVPFYFKLESDVDNTELTNYRLVKTIAVGSNTYVVAYGKLFDNIVFDNNLYKVANTAINANVSILDTVTNINPLEPEVVPNPSLAMLTNSSVITLLKATCKLTDVEIGYIRSYIDLVLLEDSTNITITELGLCTGMDIDITDGHNNKESVWTQIAFFVDIVTDLQLENTNNSLDMNIEIGGMEPLALST